MAYIIFNVARISDSIDRCIKLTNNRLISTTVKKLQNINKDLDTLSFQNVCNTSYTIPSGLSYSVNGITFSIPSTEIPGNSTINVPVKLSGTPVNEGVFNGEINVLGNVVNLRAIVEEYTQEECITYQSASPSTTITRNIERGVNLPKTEVGFVSVVNSCPVSFTIPGREFINEDGFRVYTEFVTVNASQNTNIPIYAEGTYIGVKSILEGSQSFGGNVVTARISVISHRPTTTGDIIKEAGNRVDQELSLSDFNGKWNDANGDNLEAIKILPAVGEAYLKPNLLAPGFGPGGSGGRIPNDLTELVLEPDKFPIMYDAPDVDNYEENRYRFQVKAGGEWSDL